MVKIISIALATGMVLYTCFYLPKGLKPGRGAKLRYLMFSVIAFLAAVMLLKLFR